MCNEKIKTVIKRTLEECENNGLTVSEALEVPLLLKHEITEIIEKKQHTNKFSV